MTPAAIWITTPNHPAVRSPSPQNDHLENNQTDNRIANTKTPEKNPLREIQSESTTQSRRSTKSRIRTHPRRLR